MLEIVRLAAVDRHRGPAVAHHARQRLRIETAARGAIGDQRDPHRRELILPLVFGRIDHIGVAVADLAAAIALHEDTYGMRLVHRETIEEQGVEAVLLDVGENHVELLAPLGDDTPVGRYLARRGPGLHHVAYQVADIDAALARLRDAGVRLIDEAPRVGIRRSRVAFVHPGATGGVLTELVEPATVHL